MGRVLALPTLDEIRMARQRISVDVQRTPLVKYGGDAGEPEIWLKLENLQPIGSFKLRGALNRIHAIPRSQLEGGVYTASAGNMAQGVAYAARMVGVPASVVVPDTAPEAKLEAIERLGADLVRVPYDEWWDAMRNRGREGMRGVFIHPFADRDVMAGNGSIALEIFEELTDVDAILVPWGGGGLACGIAAAARALKPDVRVVACEVEGAAPLSQSLRANAPVTIDNQRSFVDGIGGPGVFPEMWPLVREVISDAISASVPDIAEAVRRIAQRNRVIAEGAGAVALAVARGSVSALTPAPRRVACIVSGGNLNPSILATILGGGIP